MHPFFLVSLALFFIFTFALGLFTLLHNPKSKVHQLWFLVNIGGTIWSGGLFAVVWFTPNENLGLLFSRLLHLGSTMIIVFFFHFVINFLIKEKQYRNLIIINYLIGLIFLIILFFSNWLIKGVAPKSTFDLWVDPGILYLLYVVYYLIAVLLSHIFLYRGFKENEGFKKRQIQIIFIATLIGFIGGMTNFLPQLFGIYPFGNFIIFLYPILITYGVFLVKD